MTGQDDRDHEHHVADDLAAGQGIDTGPDAIPAEDVAQLATIRDSVDQESAVFNDDEVEHVRSEDTHVRTYEGYLEAGSPGTARDGEESVDLLLESELREDETENPHEAAEEGLAWIPPVDPPVVPADNGQIEVAAGFGTSATDEPFDVDHHGSFELGLDERTERVREALVANAQTTNLVDRLEFDTIGSRVVVAGVVDDIDDEDEVLAVISDVEGVTDVVSRIRVASVE
jgi:hypothetical protein